MDREPQQDISVNDEGAEFIRQELEAGRFDSASDVVNEALRKMRRLEDYRRWLQARLAESEKDIAAGRVFAFEDVMDELDELDKREQSELRQRRRA
ncbi:MAG TPA: type II toxin-antitoxin system ParD family antitoxin [Phycisphaerales bacterium]|nr:type II toxin-antitoxin system ParD family antitoxin [Phycisphaerales bacterium]